MKDNSSTSYLYCLFNIFNTRHYMELMPKAIFIEEFLEISRSSSYEKYFTDIVEGIHEQFGNVSERLIYLFLISSNNLIFLRKIKNNDNSYIYNKEDLKMEIVLWKNRVSHLLNL